MEEYFVLVPTYIDDTDIHCRRKYRIISDCDYNGEERPGLKEYCLVLDDELHYWLVERNIQYSLNRRYESDSRSWNNYINVVFDNINDAILFKLTWS